MELAAFVDLRGWFAWRNLIGPMGVNMLDNAYMGIVAATGCMVVHFVILKL